ncbi:MAG: hypothetical protein RBT63_06430 [Bdellovibrionales bacterium]|jgi:hypothetical protein|nr:hypothetical protein [Bdellovibrionales bacterium]
MKTVFWKQKFVAPLVVSVSCFIVSGVARADLAGILDATTREDLSRHMHGLEKRAIRERSCRFQRQQALPPTFCYEEKMAKDESEALDAQCLRLVRAALNVPKYDQTTSARCRNEIEKRSRDLAYAVGDSVSH